jgi:hypothetical protein
VAQHRGGQDADGPEPPADRQRRDRGRRRVRGPPQRSPRSLVHVPEPGPHHRGHVADNGNTYFIGNPGEGIATSFPKATRTYHAVTVQFSKNFSDLWQAQVSYTWSQLRGNYEGLFVNGTGQLDPNINATFDLAQLLVNQDGPLSGRHHAHHQGVRSEGVRDQPGVQRDPRTHLYGASGPPISYTGPSNETGYGPGQVYILQRGQGGRLPWVNSVDARVALNYRLSKDAVITVGVDGFNLFNFQNPIRVDEEYVTLPSLTGGGRDPGPIVNGTQGTIPAPYGVNGALPRGGVVAGPNGPELKTVVLPDPDQQPQTYAINPNWGGPRSTRPCAASGSPPASASEDRRHHVQAFVPCGAPGRAARGLRRRGQHDLPRAAPLARRLPVRDGPYRPGERRSGM